MALGIGTSTIHFDKVGAGGGGAPTGASYVVIAADGTLTAERVLTGTANQIILTDAGAGNTLTLSLPQNIHTAATPQFAGLGLGVAPSTQFHMLADGASFTIFHDSYGTTQSIYRYRRARNTFAAPRRVNTGDILGNIQFAGAEAADDATNATFGNNAFVARVEARENFTSGAHGSQLAFFPTAIGAGSTGSAALTIADEAITLGAAADLVFPANGEIRGAGSTVYFFPNTARTARLTFKTGNVPAGGPDGFGNLWGGTEQNQLFVDIHAQTDVSGGTPSNYFNGNLDYGARDASGNVATAYSWLNEGNWTNAGGFTLNRMALWNYNLGASGKTVFMTQSGTSLPVAERQVLTIGANTVGNGFLLRVNGFDVTNDDLATNGTAGFQLNNNFTSNTATTRTWNVATILPTFNFGVSNAAKTVNVLSVDTVNTAITGATINLVNVASGGSNRLALTSAGIATQVSIDGGTAGYNLESHSNNLTANTTMATFVGRVSAGTQTTPLRTQSGQVVLRNAGFGYNAADDSTLAVVDAAHRAALDLVASEDHSSGAQGMYQRFRTTATGGTTTDAKAFISEYGLELSTGNTSPTARGTTNPTNAINLFDGTAPAGTLTNGITLYSGSGLFKYMTAAGSARDFVTGPTGQAVLSKTITIENPGAAEDLSMFWTDDAITITKMVAVLVGSSTPSVTWTIRHSTDRSAAGTEVVTSGTTTTSTTTGSVVTAFNDATVVADAFVWLETTAQSGVVNSIHVTIYYTVD